MPIAIPSVANLQDNGVPCLPIHRLTVEQYHRMIKSSVLTENDRVELLEGWIIDKMPHNPMHDGTITRVQRRLGRALRDDWIIRIQSAITTKDSEPEPDLVIVPGPEELYFTRHPGPQDIALLAEISDTTLEHDRWIKGRLFARARIRIYWIVNLIDRQIEVHTNPKTGRSPAFRHRRDYGIEESVPFVIEGRIVAHIPVRELMP